MNRILGVICLCLALAPGGVLAQERIEGIVTWSQRAELGTLVSGVISRVHVRPGQVVKRGDTLVELDERGFAGQVQRWLAEYRHARGLLAEAEREDERAAELYDRTVLSDFERNQALLAVDAARARQALANARLVDARLDLERSRIKAPFDGVVLQVNAVPGQPVISEVQVQPLVALADNTRLTVRAELQAGSVAGVAAGQVISLIAGDKPFEGTVAYVGMEPLPPGGSGLRYALHVDVDPGQAPGLRVGETVLMELD